MSDTNNRDASTTAPTAPAPPPSQRYRIPPAPWTESTYTQIARNVRPIGPDTAMRDMQRLTALAADAAALMQAPARSRVGNDVVDRFTLAARMHTRGKYGASFFDFMQQIDAYAEKPFVRNLLAYYETKKNARGHMHPHRVLKETYNLCISAINAFRPLAAAQLFHQHRAQRVLAPCLGWGGAAVAAAALRLPRFVGVDRNADLAEPYAQLTDFLAAATGAPDDAMAVHIADARDAPWGDETFDTVLLTPPYYALERYAHEDDRIATRTDWDVQFYMPLARAAWAALEPDGRLLVNVCAEAVDRAFTPVLGPPDDKQVLGKSARQNKHTEWVFIWNRNRGAAPP